MTISRNLKIGVLILTALSVVWFPWILTEALMIASALIFPPTAIAYGVLADVLYYPGSGYPLGLVTGVVMTLGALMVRYFVKTRIM